MPAGSACSARLPAGKSGRRAILTCWSTSPKTGSLFDLLRMTRELEDLLGHSVDVVSAGGLKDRDRDILDESVGL
jgi:hypothetical protein